MKCIFNQLVFLCTDHRFIPAFFYVKIADRFFFSLNKAFIIITYYLLLGKGNPPGERRETKGSAL